MRRRTFGKNAGIIALLLSLILFVPSALSQAERTADSAVGALTGASAAETCSADAASEKNTTSGIGVGTIATGKAIAEAAVIAIAASQPDSSDLTSIY